MWVDLWVERPFLDKWRHIAPSHVRMMNVLVCRLKRNVNPTHHDGNVSNIAQTIDI